MALSESGWLARIILPMPSLAAPRIKGDRSILVTIPCLCSVGHMSCTCVTRHPDRSYGHLSRQEKVWVPSTAANACVLQLSRAGWAGADGLVSSAAASDGLSGLVCS